MFYNSFRATRSSLKENRNRSRFRKISQKERMINLQKRKKLKDLLIQKFSEKYDFKKSDNCLENEITSFVQKEKINDIDLKRLNDKLRLIARDNSEKSLSTNNFVKLYSEGPSTRNKKKINLVKKKEIIPNIINKTVSKKDDNSSITLPKLKKELNKSLSSTKMDMNKTKTVFNRKPILYNNNFFKSKEEELAALEDELRVEESKFNRTRRERLDFTKEGDEWSAITKYNRQLFEKQKREEKIRENEMKKRTKEYLDIQVREKMIKEHQEELRENEYHKIIIQNLKKMDDIEKEKAQKMKLQFIKEKERFDLIFKEENIRKRIEELKEKKFEREYVKRIKEKIEEEKKAEQEDKKKKNEEMNKAIKENELKKEKIKEEIEKQKKDEINILKEKEKLEEKEDYYRNLIFQRVQNNANKFTMTQAEKVVKQMKEAQKNEEEKMLNYFEEKRKKDEENELIKKIRQNKERKELKKFLDRQIEEKKKEENLKKELDIEQARIWSIDIKKQTENENFANSKIKDMHKRNFSFVVKQMNELKKKKRKLNNMTDDEYYMNIDLLEKAKASLNP